jgi:hypothetical protein
MKVLIFLLAIVCGLALGAYMTREQGYGALVSNMLQNLIGSGLDGYNSHQLQQDMVDQVNYARISGRASPVKVDWEMQNWLNEHAETLDFSNLDALTKTLQGAQPRYLRLAVCYASSPTLSLLGQEFYPYTQKVEAEFNAVAVMVREKAAHLGHEALLVTGLRLDDFTPEALSEHVTDTFFSRCLHCGHGHPCRVSAAQRGIEIECPECGRTYAVLATDSRGRFRYVNEFLTGYQPPASYPEDMDRLEEMYMIWRTVVSHCTYTRDSSDPARKRDSWQTALETQCLQRGDCEDSTIFLADWLMARGFQVRVALGHYGDIGEHAWCVVRLDNVDYLLESTEGPPDPSEPPYASDVGSRYTPETLFDRDAIYVRSKPREPFKSSEYWKFDVWTKLQPRTMFAAPGTAPGGLADTLKLNKPSIPSGKSNTVGSSLYSAPFVPLTSIPLEGTSWEVLSPLSPHAISTKVTK